ncbi:MAG: cupin domain-containing protein [Oscillospiraceae bacterium]|nr:cupin domain-containing protein [Oscillospiraceae bacterium]
MITVRKPTPEEVLEMQAKPTWSCEASQFKWSYNDSETCLIIKGRVKVTYDGGSAEFGEGDLVVFAKGLQCEWHVIEDVEKYYKFG